MRQHDQGASLYIFPLHHLLQNGMYNNHDNVVHMAVSLVTDGILDLSDILLSADSSVMNQQ